MGEGGTKAIKKRRSPRAQTVRVAPRERAALKRFKALMKKNSGKLKFAGFVD